MDGVVIFFLAYGSVFNQRAVAFDIQLCLPQSGLRFGELAFGLIQLSLKRPRINLKKNVALFDGIAFGVILFGKISNNLRAHLGIDQAVHIADPLVVNWNVGLGDGKDLDGWWRRSGGRGFLFATSQKEQRHKRG